MFSKSLKLRLINFDRIIKTKSFARCSLNGNLKHESRPHHQNFPSGMKSDWIGPPDPASNLCLVKFHIPKEETCAERHLRMLREETQNWNHEFWTKHNRNFLKEKEAFILKKAAELNHLEETRMNNHLSEFYRKFLDDNYELHRQYNKEWYKRNFALLWPAFRVYLQKMFNRRNS